MKLATLFLLLLAPLASFGQSPVYVEKAMFKPEAAKLTQALDAAHLYDAQWYVFVLSQASWDKGFPTKHDASAKKTCYTLASQKMTWCNVDWVKDASTEAIIQTLRHEYGHIHCQIQSETCAEAYAGLFH